MTFQFYDPEEIIPSMMALGITSSSYTVCPGCVLTKVPPEHCYREADDMKAPSTQSDMLCPHCYDVSEEHQEPFPLNLDENLNKKITELKEILRALEGIEP